MKRLFASIGLPIFLGILLLPSLARAEVFDLLYEEARRQVLPDDVVDEEMVTYVQFVFENRLENPLDVTKEDIEAAVAGTWGALCSGKNISYIECTELFTDIAFVVEQETEVRQLGDELLAISSASELANADEPARPLSAGPAAQAFNAVWSGTGSSSLGWPDDDGLSALVSELEGALESMEEVDRAKAVKRYHFGLFRSEAELARGEIGTLGNYAGNIGAILGRIAAHPDINIDPAKASRENVGEFTPPSIGDNIALWVREDDIGIHEIYPVHITRFDVRPALREYPLYAGGLTNGNEEIAAALSYPFEYDGPAPGFPFGIMSPLCSRSAGRFGYLCRAVPSLSSDCSSSSATDAITITTCDEESDTNPLGPTVCSDEIFANQFVIQRQDAQGEYVDQSPPSASGIPSVCSPLTRTTFDSSLVTNACYISACLAESLSEHSLLGNRNTIAIMEPVSPYQSCMRDDPQVGIYAEMAPAVASAIPPYRGHELVRALDSEFCAKTGQAFPGFSGLCEAKAMRAIGSPGQTYVTTAVTAEILEAFHNQTRAQLIESSFAIGQRFALDQALPVYRHLAKGMAQMVQETADLLTELVTAAPLTTTACPWTGGLAAEACGTQDPL